MGLGVGFSVGGGGAGASSVLSGGASEGTMFVASVWILREVVRFFGRRGRAEEIIRAVLDRWREIV